MCNQSCLVFGAENLSEPEIRTKSILEVGSRDVNGSLRPYLQSLYPTSYVGTDIYPGPGVDLICNAEHLTARFGPNAFDVVVSTEMMEHARNWQEVIINLKSVLRPAAILLLTTRSRGFHFHEAPHDFWRYELSDMQQIFSDFHIQVLQPDLQEPGVFLKARKPLDYSPNDLSGLLLYSMVTHTHVHSVAGPCESKYEGKLVRREGDTPEDRKVYLIRESLRHWIINSAWIQANGLRWPEDVTVIPTQELDEIPAGDPIS